MRAVVFGYSNIGDRCLRLLRARGVEVPLVVTHRDSAGEVVWFDRVADTASELRLPLVYCDRGADPALWTAVQKAAPDVIFSFYCRFLLSPALLDLATLGAFNMHGSLLPHYRGRAPTNWAVLHGETETGATLHEMVARADAGRIVDKQAVPILPDDVARQVFDKVTVAAEQVLWRNLAAIEMDTVVYRPNPIELGSYFGSRTPEDGRLDWSKPAREVYDLIRAVAPPYPGAFCEVGGVRLVVAAARCTPPPVASKTLAQDLGLRVVDDHIVGRCGDGGEIVVHELRAGAVRITSGVLDTLLAAHDAKT